MHRAFFLILSGVALAGFVAQARAQPVIESPLPSGDMRTVKQPLTLTYDVVERDPRSDTAFTADYAVERAKLLSSLDDQHTSDTSVRDTLSVLYATRQMRKIGFGWRVVISTDGQNLVYLSTPSGHFFGAVRRIATFNRSLFFTQHPIGDGVEQVSIQKYPDLRQMPQLPFIGTNWPGIPWIEQYLSATGQCRLLIPASGRSARTPYYAIPASVQTQTFHSQTVISSARATTIYPGVSWEFSDWRMVGSQPVPGSVVKSVIISSGQDAQWHATFEAKFVLVSAKPDSIDRKYFEPAFYLPDGTNVFNGATKPTHYFRYRASKGLLENQREPVLTSAPKSAQKRSMAFSWIAGLVVLTLVPFLCWFVAKRAFSKLRQENFY